MPRGKRQIAASTGGSTSRAAKRARQESPEPRGKPEGGPEVATQQARRGGADSEVRIKKTARNMKKGSFVKTQRFVNGELVEESVEELDEDQAKAIMKEQEAELRAMRHELHKAFKDHQKVWKRLLEEAPRHFPKANSGWFSQGLGGAGGDMVDPFKGIDDDMSPILDVDDVDDDVAEPASDIDDSSEAPLRAVDGSSHRARRTLRK